ncbi:mRNA export factor Mex67p [[Candida] anglica]|uniref:mRNA export factor Mex67p n=1 Tax=[Candida] anglica TaxID=148631 RepID=A0ABP0EJX3_9ASCO
MSYRGRGRGGYNNNNGNRGGFSQQNVDQFAAANSVPVEILGWNNATQEECISFIARKTKISVMNASVDQQTGILRGYVRTAAVADELTQWSGVKFAGQSLKITKAIAVNSISGQMGLGVATNTNNSKAPNTIETITTFLKSRYNPESKLLNLSAVDRDPQLQQEGFFASISTTSKFFPALMKIADELKLEVDSVDVSGNNLKDLTSISTLAQTFPLLKNLALSNNNITNIRTFELWKRKLNFLRELVVMNNPLVSNLRSANEVDNIKLEMMKNFPRLVVLNGEIVRDENKLLSLVSFPFATQGMFFQDETIQQVSTNFITNFFNLWDTNRQELMILYQQESQFSMQVDSSHPHVIEIESGPSTNSRSFSSYNNSNNNNDSPFGYYIPHSRNLTKVSSVKSKMARLAVGQQNIFKMFSQLPKTRHDLLSNPNLFSLESYSYPQLGGILLTLHGYFEETAIPDDNSAVTNPSSSGGNNRNRFQKNNNKKIPLGKKSFDRTFVIIPGPNGSMIVASDLLTVRLFADADAWNTPTPTPVVQAGVPSQQVPTNVPAAVPNASIPAVPAAAPGAPTPNDLPPDVKANLNDLQQQILVRVLVDTKLNFQFAIMLCEQSQWDYQQCINNFKQSVATLPPTAYM